MSDGSVDFTVILEPYREEPDSTDEEALYTLLSKAYYLGREDALEEGRHRDSFGCSCQP